MGRFAFQVASPAMALLAAGAGLAQDRALPEGPISRAMVVAGVERQFAQLDSNHDGVVDRAEFDSFRQRMSAVRAGGAPAPGGAGFARVGGKWFERADADRDGRVTLAEAEARPMQMFDLADTNHDGTVSVEERKLAMVLMGAR